MRLHQQPAHDQILQLFNYSYVSVGCARGVVEHSRTCRQRPTARMKSQVERVALRKTLRILATVSDPRA